MVDDNRDRWPRCLARLSITAEIDFQSTAWMCPETGAGSKLAKNSGLHALLFEYLPGIIPLTKEMVTRQIAEDVNQVLANLHTLDVLHRDLEELNAYPDVGFRNIFLRSDPITGQKCECYEIPTDSSMMLIDPKLSAFLTSIAQKSHPTKQNSRRNQIEWLKCSKDPCRTSPQRNIFPKKQENFCDVHREQEWDFRVP